MSELSPKPSETESDPERDRLKGVSLAKRISESVRRLPGFDKSKHRVPTEINDRSQSFVEALSTRHIREDLDRVFQLLRTAFRFKRTQLETYETKGAGSITTPFFRYTSCVYQDPQNAEEVVWQRDISNVTAADELLTSQFEEVFREVFDTVEFVPTSTIDLEKLIDTLEDIDDERIRLHYDRELTYCEVEIEGAEAKLEVTADAFRVVHPQPQLPRVLVSSFFELQDALVDFSSVTE